ncbi:MAG: beta-ketoacyl synthase N-terminal-like domain-containing protein [Candidatus Omnitrophota bacterium]
MPDKRIAITGIGPIACAGIGREKFWQGILDKKTNIRKEKYFLDEELWAEFPLHKVDNFALSQFGLDKDKLNGIKEWKEGEEIPDLNYLIACVKLALDDSKLDYHKEDNRIGLVLAHENLGLMDFGYKVSNLAYEMLIGKKKAEFSKKDFFDKFYRKFLKSGYDVQTFADLFHVARVFNIHNYSLFINNACASGLYAFEAASQVIKNNQAKAVVIAAAEHPEIYKYLWFKELGIYSPDGILRPFSKDSNGLVFGDGGVGIVMEDLEFAQKRKAPIYAEYLGGGFDLEGWKITVPQIGNDSYQKAIARAFSQSGIKKDEVDLLCPHGVGSQPIDYYEAKAITDTFGANPKKPLITTFKSTVGHNLGGSALLESAIMLLALQNNIIPPTLNCDNPDPKFNISLVKEKKETKLNIAMKICCAFAGFNAACIFKKAN